MRLCIGTLICLLMLSSVAFAAPLTDYSLGKTAIDLTVRPNSDITINDHGTLDLDGKNNNFDWAITTGLGNKWAIQYRQFNAKSEPYKLTGNTVWRTKSQEINALYQLDKTLSAFVGVVRAKSNNETTGNNTGTKNAMQVGLIGSTEIYKNVSLYGIAGVGNDVTNLEAGLSYKITPSFDFNVSYRSLKVTNIPKGNNWGDNSEYKTKGIGYGITYKF